MYFDELQRLGRQNQLPHQALLIVFVDLNFNVDIDIDVDVEVYIDVDDVETNISIWYVLCQLCAPSFLQV